MTPEREGAIPQEARKFKIPDEESLQTREDFDGLVFRLEQQIGLFNPPESDDAFDREMKMEMLGLVSSLKTAAPDQRGTILKQIDQKLGTMQADDEVDQDAKREALSLVRQLRDSIA